MPNLPAADVAVSSELRLAVLRLARRLRAQRTDASMSLSQMAVLATLKNDGPLCPSELAARERVRPPSMTRTIALLEQKGLVQRSPHPSDRRQTVVDLTEAGRALLAADRKRRDAWLARRLAELSPEELRTLRAAAPVLARLAGS